VRYSVTVRQTKTIRAATTAIDQAAWLDIPYSPDGVAQVAETSDRGDRLIVRRSATPATNSSYFRPGATTGL
jgi:hypothetical protein